MEGINFYMINLDRASRRRQLMKDHYDTDNLIRVSAYDGKYLHEYKDIKYLNDSFYAERKSKQIDNFDAIRVENETACTLSHIKAITFAYYKGEQGAIIIEDDILNKYHSQWSMSLRDIIHNAPSDCDILFLHEINDQANKAMIPMKQLIIRKRDDHYSNGCYYITRKGMKKIVDKYFINGTIDITRENKHLVADLNLFNGMNQYQYTKPLFNAEAVDSFIRGNINCHKRCEQITDMYYDKSIAVRLAREKLSKTKFRKVVF